MSTDAKRAGNERYLAKLDRVVIRLHQDGTDGLTKDQVQAAAEAYGQSVNQFVIDAIKARI